MGSITKHVSPRTGKISWRAVIELPRGGDGRRRQDTKTFATRREAEDWLTLRRGQLVLGTVGSGEKMLLRDYLATHWLPFYKGQMRASSYVNREGCCRLHIIPALGHLRMGKITPVLVQTFYNDLSTRLKPNSVRAIAQTLNASMNRAVQWELLHRNPCRGAQVKILEQRESTIWTPENFQAFLSHEPDVDWKTLWTTLAETGMRISELLPLRWDDVDWELGVLRVERTVTKKGIGEGKTIGPPKSERGKRPVALSPVLLTMLREMQHRQEQLAEGQAISSVGTTVNLNLVKMKSPPPPLIFPRSNGLMIDANVVRKRFARITVKAGLPPIRLHDLRHGNVAMSLEAGIPLVVISERLGHSSIKITGDLYARITQRLDQQTAKVIGGILLGNGSEGETDSP